MRRCALSYDNLLLCLFVCCSGSVHCSSCELSKMAHHIIQRDMLPLIIIKFCLTSILYQVSSFNLTLILLISWDLTPLPTTSESILFSPLRTGEHNITSQATFSMSCTLFLLSFIKTFEKYDVVAECQSLWTFPKSLPHRLAGVRRLAPSTELVRNQTRPSSHQETHCIVDYQNKAVWKV